MAISLIPFVFVGKSESLFQQIGCFRKSIGFGNRFLEMTCIIAIGRVVEHLLKKKRKAGYEPRLLRITVRDLLFALKFCW
jgi:hypothetical protein